MCEDAGEVERMTPEEFQKRWLYLLREFGKSSADAYRRQWNRAVMAQYRNTTTASNDACDYVEVSKLRNGRAVAVRSYVPMEDE